MERKRKEEEEHKRLREEENKRKEEEERKRKEIEESKRKEEEDRIRRLQQREELISKAKAHLKERALIESLSFVNELFASFPNDKDVLELRQAIVTSFNDDVSEV